VEPLDQLYGAGAQLAYERALAGALGKPVAAIYGSAGPGRVWHEAVFADSLHIAVEFSAQAVTYTDLSYEDGSAPEGRGVVKALIVALLALYRSWGVAEIRALVRPEREAWLIAHGFAPRETYSDGSRLMVAATDGPISELARG
jgi:hypothetical protein